MRKIIKNKIRCNKCGVELESTYREDFSCCDCGAVAISGGLEYLRRIGQIDKIVEFSEYEEEATVYFCTIVKRVDTFFKEKYLRTVA